jgi:exodeoxyribonuclease V alpha subunit
MQTHNNYQREVYNGDLGFIETIDHTDHLLRIRMDHRLIEYDWTDVDELAHAYAISVHRSQGNEYPAVVIPVVTQHYLLLQRNLLYTAITRAKQVVVLVGSRKAIAIAVKNDSINRRYSGLVTRIKQQKIYK